MDDLLHQDSAVPAKGQQVITCVALIHKLINGVPHVLLAKRSEEKKFLPGILELPGGHINFGENLEAGLARELKEELNIDVLIGDPFAAFTYVNEIKGSHSVEIIYFVKLKDENQDIQVNPHDHSGILWISTSSLEQVEALNGTDDQELTHIRYGLNLLEGKPINYGA